MKNKLQIGDYYEFCTTIDGMSHVLYGRITKVVDDETADFIEVLNHVHSKVSTGKIYKNVTSIRGLNNFKW